MKRPISAALLIGCMTGAATAQPHLSLAAGAATAGPQASPATGASSGSANAEIVPPLRLEAQVQLSVDEDRLSVNLEYSLSNGETHPIDLTAAKYLLPLPAPIVGGTVLDRGSIPAAAQTVEAEVTGDIKVERQRGGLAVVGTLAPGAQATVRARYFIGYADSTLRLGLRGAGKATYATVVVASSVPGRTRLTTDRPARSLRYEQGDERLVGLAMAQPLGPNEVVVLELADLPAPAAGPRRALTSAAVTLGALGLWWLVRRRPEDVHGA